MSKDIEVSRGQKGDVAIIAIKGDVTAMSGAVIEKEYQEATSEGASKILLLFGGENYINSGGIAILIGMAAESRKNNRTIRMTGLTEHFQKIFKMVGLTKYAEIFPTEEAALEGF